VNLRLYSKLIASTLLVGLPLVSTTAYGGMVIGDTPLRGNPHVAVGIPQSETDTSIIVSRKQYVVSWDYEQRTPTWVAWNLNKRALGDAPRSDVFRLDRDLDEVLVDQNLNSVGPNDYKTSCLDRGHQVPSGDRTASARDNEATFLMSNIMPQSAHLNRRTWVSLERFLRRQVLENSQHVHIYAGVVVDPKGHAIGPNEDIKVPLRNFKIAVLMPASRDAPPRESMSYFVVDFPNVTSRGTNPVVDHEQACYDSEHTVRLDEANRQSLWRPFLSTLARVERQSGIDFSFLKDLHEMTAAEVDEMIDAEAKRAIAPLQEPLKIAPMAP
jgi:endonuclease G